MQTNHISKGKPIIKAAAPREPPNSNSSDSPFGPMTGLGPEGGVGAESLRFLSVPPMVDVDVDVDVEDDVDTSW